MHVFIMNDRDICTPMDVSILVMGKPHFHATLHSYYRQ